MESRDSSVVTPDYAVANTAHPPGFRKRRGQNWFFLGLTYASYYLCRYNLSIIAPELMRDLGLNKQQYGRIQSSRDLAYAIGQFINGLFTDRIGGKQAMTFGAIGTVIFNLIFGLTAWSNFSWLFAMLVVVRFADGYMQAFGAPGMVKINTAWFRRHERGGFAGIFGGMIQLGAIGVGKLGSLLATGFAVPLIFFSLTVPKTDWRYMFIIPPAIVVVIIVLMNLFVKNHPEEAGFRVLHDDEDESDDPHAKIHVGEVFRRIASNPVVWIVAGAYFCTGYVRRAIESWWVVYLEDAWGAGKTSGLFAALVLLIPITAFIGSFGSGIISDKLVGGRRAPVAAVLYLSQTILILIAIFVSWKGIGSAVLAAALVVGISMACNSTHSLLGTAAAMDLGGRKMAGFSSGVIDSFQYFGAMLAGELLGYILSRFSRATSAGSSGHAPMDPVVWMTSMLPFALLGTGLMMYLWLRHRGKGTRGT
jgi:OPA family glycerol-3-phosphate transporter-like MFS transporter